MKLKTFLIRRKKLLRIIAAIMLALMLILAGWWYVHRLKEPVITAENAIPGDVTWYIKFNRATDLWKKIHNENDIFRELKNIDFFRSAFCHINSLDSVLVFDADAADLIAGQSIYICCRYSTDKPAEYLILMNLPDAHEEGAIHDIMKRHINGHLLLTEDKMDGRVINICKADKNSFVYTVTNGIFMFSHSECFVQSAITQLKRNAFRNTDNEFSKVYSTTGKNVDGNFYINLHSLRSFLDPVLDKSYAPAKEFLALTASWAGLDLIIKKDEILMNGYINAMEKDYLHVFKNRKPQKIELTHFIPFNTAVMLYMGSDNFTQYIDDYHLFLRKNSLPDVVVPLHRQDRFRPADLKESILPWLGNEAALVITESKDGDFKSNTFGVLRVANRALAKEKLDAISIPWDIIDKDEGEGNEKVFEICRIPCEGFLQAMFGKIFSNITGNYYLFLEDYVVFGNSPQSLRMFISAYLSNKTLDKNENYKAFADNVSDNASLCLYVNIRKSVKLIKSFTNPSVRALIDPYTSQLRNFQAFAIQISPDKDMLYANVYLKYNPSYKDENPAVWETQLDTTITGKPFLITDIHDSSRKIVVFDQLNKIYLLDDLGRIKWKISLPEKPLGDIYMVDRNRNRKSQIVFNTTHRIYMIDIDGNSVPGFPVTLSYPATNGLIVVDYNNTKDYRILLVCDDHKLYNFTIDGRKTRGWTLPSIGATVNDPVVHIRMPGKDYLIVTDNYGKCHYYDRKGNTAILKFQAEFLKSKYSGYFVYSNRDKSCIIATDRRGRIIMTAPNGNREAINLKEFSPEHKFLYADFDGNAIRDYIFADSNKVRVYDVNKKLIFKLDIPDPMSTTPVKIEAALKTPMFGVVSESSGKIYLFSMNGLSPVNQYLSGSTEFCTGKLERSAISSLIVGKGKTVYNYYLTGL